MREDERELVEYLTGKRIVKAKIEMDSLELVLSFDDGTELSIIARANRAGDDIWLEFERH